MSNLIKRSLTGVVFVAIVIGSILLGPDFFAGFFVVISQMALFELLGLFQKGGYKPNKILGVLAGVSVYVLLTVVLRKEVAAVYLLLLVPIGFLLALAELYRKHDKPFQNIALTCFGVIYAVVPFALLNGLFNLQGGIISGEYELVLGFFCMIWASDTGAYLVGTQFGKHRLFERISPKKSWEGSVGGSAVAVGVGLLFAHLFPAIAPIHWVVMALICVVFGTLGDLVESMLKRSLNVKDSGTALPGHGGFLDRFDAVLGAAPVLFVYILIASNAF